MYVLLTKEELEYLLDTLLDKIRDVGNKSIKDNLEKYTIITSILKQVQVALCDLDKEVND